MLNDILKKNENENNIEYKKRLIDGKLTNKTLNDFSHSELSTYIFGKTYSNDVARRMAYGAKYILDLLYDEDFEDLFNDDILIENIKERQFQIDKQLVKLRDYRNLVNEKVRELSRFENIKEIICEVAENLNKEIPLFEFTQDEYINTGRSGILVLSDWHFGVDINNFLNKFNMDVFKYRINKLVKETINDIKEHKFEKLYIVNLNDLISGIIHNTIRLQNREDVISQIMIVAETLAEILHKLSGIVNIEYHSVLDNHSRIIADKKNSLDVENLTRIIDWHLEARFKNNNKIKICENEIDKDICTFEVYGFNYLGTHGHKDNISSVVQNMSLMTKKFYNVILTAHLHHFHSDEIHSTYVFSNGCLSGVDAHSKDLRKSSNPSQNLIIVSKDDCVKYLHTIKLN